MIKDILKNLKQNKSFVSWIILILIPVFTGIVMSYALFRQSVQMGDPSTFLSFARNIVNGEAIFSDFIHFRTPADYFFKAIFVWLFGDSISSINLSQAVESHVVYSSLIMLAAAVLYKFKKPYMGLILLPLVILTPGLTQIRSVLALLAVVVYIYRLDSGNSKLKWPLLLSGVLGGLSFCFGQEMGILVIILIGMTELIINLPSKKYKLLFSRLSCLAAGVLIGIAPLIIYVLLYSNIYNFFYYVFYYAMILQPSGMDLPFPRFCYENLVYYLPFILYGISFFIIFCNKKKNLVGGVLLSFGILRLVTLCGRSDILHLLFSVSEVFIIVPYAILQIKQGDYSFGNVKKFIKYGVCFIVFSLLAIFYKSLLLIFVVITILIALNTKKDQNVKKVSYDNIKAYVLATTVSIFVLFVYLMTPHFISTAKQVHNGLKNRSAERVSGAKASDNVKAEINDITSKVKPLNPKTIFAFPIQAYYYSLAPNHAARFMTFEPQTTLLEQNQTIDDLKKTKPEVVIFDPAQASDLSNATWKISDYIMSNYSIKYRINHNHILWIMVPNKEKHSGQNYLAFDLHKNNSNNFSYGIQSPEKGMNNAIAQINNSFVTFEVEEAGVLTTSMSNELKQDDCGSVEIIHSDNKTISRKVCYKDGIISIPINKNSKLRFVNKNSKTVIWNDPRIDFTK